MARTVEGIVRKHREGFGFLIQPKGTDDVYIPAEDLIGVMDGDRIEAQLFKRRGRTAGRLIAILERGRRLLLGTYRQRGRQGWVEPSDPGLHEEVLARVACEPAPSDGQRVKLALTDWPTGVSPAKGEVVAVLGDGEHPMQEVLAMAYARGFSDTFAADVTAETASTPDRVGIGDLAGRRDLRGLPLVTIDGADAKDFDDAIFVETVPGGGYRLVVAIADVVHYVREGTALDQEALSRGTSVYFPGMVLPMLPEELSNGICSLVPGEDRLCMVADLILTPEGKTINTELYEGVMRSHARLTYDDVAQMMDELGIDVSGQQTKSAGEQEVGCGVRRRRRPRDARRRWARDTLPSAVELSRKLYERRLARGCIDFDLAESEVVLNEDCMPIAIEPRERIWPHRLIEEFMLAANEAVAFFFHRHGLPAIYRVHDEPDEEKLATFATLARAHGFTMEPGDDIPSFAINEFLHSLVGRPEQHTLNHLLLRAMQQAIYSSENIGHYGLAAPHYLHFTSPIRRYPDLMVHRLLKSHWQRAGRVPSPKKRKRTEEHLTRISTQSSERERAAVEAEREAKDYFAALYMRDRVGEEFDAKVATVTAFGIFAELFEVHVQGLVKIEALGDDVAFDEDRMRMVARRSGRSWSVGDQLRVVCASVDLGRRQIDFEPVAEREEDRSEQRAKGRGETKARKKTAEAKRASPRKKGGRRTAKVTERDPKRSSSKSDEKESPARRGKTKKHASSRRSEKSGRSTKKTKREKPVGEKPVRKKPAGKRAPSRRR